MDCSVIIVSYNTFQLTRKAVASVLETGRDLEIEVIVVDNDSPDDSASKLSQVFDATQGRVRIIRNDHNAGFSTANNQGAAVARGRILFFLNPDTLVLDGAIQKLVSFLDSHPSVGAVGPRVLNGDRSEQLSTLPLFSYRTLLRQYLPINAILSGKTEVHPEIPDSSREVDVLKGCAIAMRKSSYETVGGWDESYFMYAEEVELCYTLQNAGLTNYYLREAAIVHYGGASGAEQYAEQQVLNHRSNLMFLRRHHGPAILWLNRIAGTVGFLARAIVFRILSTFSRERSEEYRRRGQAASALWHWFLFRYS